MEVWQIWCVFGLLLLILEMFTPVLFFINLSLAAFLTAIFAYSGMHFMSQTVTFAVMSVILIIFLRPLMVDKIKPKNSFTGIQGKYIGHDATVVKEVTVNDGRIALYGEEWNARSLNNETIPVGAVVKIKNNDSLIMYVEEVKEQA